MKGWLENNRFPFPVSPIQNVLGNSGSGLIPRPHCTVSREQGNTWETVGNSGNQSEGNSPLASSGDEEDEAIRYRPPWADGWLKKHTIKLWAKSWGMYMTNHIQRIQHRLPVSSGE